MSSQNTDQLLMIRPVSFFMNLQTATDNHDQQNVDGMNNEKAQEMALKEFDAFVAKLRNAGVSVTVIEDTPNPATPDSIFPNNWVSFHEDESVFLYPMCAENRRAERRMDILEQLEDRGFCIDRVFDLTDAEKDGQFLEGTGSLVLDHENRIAYACLSQRTHPDVLEEWAELTGYSTVTFEALQEVNGNWLPIYHTNVMISVGQELAILCADCIKNASERNAVIASLKNSGKEIVFISEKQKSSFAGNMLQVMNDKGEKIMLMSTKAFESLTAEQVATIENTNRILHSSLHTIETLGGGSARCMMAEIFLPKA